MTIFRVVNYFMIISVIFIVDNCSRTKKQTDKEMYANIFLQMHTYTKVLENIYKPFQDAISTDNAIKAISLADDINKELSFKLKLIQDIEIPDMENKEVENMLLDSKRGRIVYFLMKCDILKKFIDYAKTPTPYILEDISKSNEEAEKYAFASMRNIVDAGAKLGITVEGIEALEMAANKNMISKGIK